MYLSKLEAMLEYHNSGDVIDKTKMATCPTKSQYDVLSMSNNDGDKKETLLFYQNKRACVIMVIGQKTNHGLAMIDKRKTDDQPHEVAWKAIKTMK